MKNITVPKWATHYCIQYKGKNFETEGSTPFLWIKDIDMITGLFTSDYSLQLISIWFCRLKKD